MPIIGDLFRIFLIDPLTNLFVVLGAVTGSAGIAVILLTIIIRLITLPLTLKQMHSTRAMAALSPRMQEIQKKYKDPRRRSEEQMKLYKEMGINPLGCGASMILQFPILIALYRTFSVALGTSPEALIQLSSRLYPIDFVRMALPLNAEFLWLHLGQPDPIILPVCVAATTYILQKLTVMPATDERMRAQNSMMNMMMPLLFGWITISLPSGLGLYYALSNIIGMAMQYLYVGGGAINWRGLVGLNQDPVLPNALVVKQRQMDAAASAGSPMSNDETGVDQAKSNGSAAARSRRRYSSGRRRGRR